MSFPSLYAICDVANVTEDLHFVSELLRLGVEIIQLRAKNSAPQPLGRFIRETMARRDEINPSTKIVLNDFVDLAVETGVDGVHLGQDDISPVEARAALGPAAIIGFSTHTLIQVEAAPLNELSYLAFGPIFSSTTKSGHAEITGVAEIKRVVERIELPLVAIGGISCENAESVFRAGASSVAVISALRAAPSLTEAIEDFRAAFIKSRQALSASQTKQ